jgi:FxsC-like protein
MSDPLFFFSHAEANRDPYLTRLFEDLSHAVRAQDGSHADNPGFMASDVVLGHDWQSAGDALRTCQTFVALLSVAYFQSEQCGREWALFQRRVDAADNDESRIVPVIWVPPAARTFPPAVTHLLGGVELGLSDESSSKGLRFLMRLGRREYDGAVDGLARMLVARARKAPLPWLRELPSPREVKSAFADFAPPSATPKSIIVVPMAGSRTDASGVRRFVESYGPAPGRDWRPFFPPLDERIETLTRDVAAQEGYSCEHLAPADDLADRIAQAGQKNQPVIVLLDAWVAVLPSYREPLARLADQARPNLDFLIVENGDDEETRGQRKTLDTAMRSIVEALARSKAGPIGTVRSAEEFKLRFSQTLVGILGRMMQMTEPIRRLPATIALPTIGGPGGSRR